MRKLKKKPILFILLLSVFAVIGGVWAYYNSEDTFQNQFTTNTYKNIKIEEEFYDTWGTKEVYFVNEETTNSPVVIRMSYDEYWMDSSDNYLNNNIGGNNLVTKTWTNDFINDFLDGGDGWYYYTKVLNPNSSVQVLSAIQLNTSILSNYAGKRDYLTGHYHLNFNFEAIQANENAILDNWNKVATINGGNITWQL